MTKGTIEELRYLRQVYKIHLKDDTITDTENPDRLATNKRIFKAVAGDVDRKGELFGIVSMSSRRDKYGFAGRASLVSHAIVTGKPS